MGRRGVIWLAVATALATPTFAAAYDDTWYETDFWPGEYPDGFSVTKEITVRIRATPDPDAPAGIDCLLPKGATYHPWNDARVASDHLTFKSFTVKQVYRIKEPYTATLTRDSDSTDAEVSFAVGDTWTFLADLGEGAYLMDKDGTIYVGQQDLFDVSENASDVWHSGLEQWLGLTCANGAEGWFPLFDAFDYPEIEPAQVAGYGKAEDLAD